jgi:hypothetical protein
MSSPEVSRHRNLFPATTMLSAFPALSAVPAFSAFYEIKGLSMTAKEWGVSR